MNLLGFLSYAVNMENLHCLLFGLILLSLLPLGAHTALGIAKAKAERQELAHGLAQA